MPLLTTSRTTVIYGVNLGTELYLRLTPAGLEITADVGDQDTTVVLNRYHVRELRLALARIEKEVTE